MDDKMAKIKLPRSVSRNGSMYLSEFACHPALGGEGHDQERAVVGGHKQPKDHLHYTLTNLTQFTIPETSNFLSVDTGEKLSVKRPV